MNTIVGELMDPIGSGFAANLGVATFGARQLSLERYREPWYERLTAKLICRSSATLIDQWS